MPNRAPFSIVRDIAQQIRSRPPDRGVPCEQRGTRDQTQRHRSCPIDHAPGFRRHNHGTSNARDRPRLQPLRLHPRRTACRDRDHRHARRPAPAGGAVFPGIRPPQHVRQQPPPDRPWCHQLPRRQAAVSARSNAKRYVLHISRLQRLAYSDGPSGLMDRLGSAVHRRNRHLRPLQSIQLRHPIRRPADRHDG